MKRAGIAFVILVGAIGAYWAYLVRSVPKDTSPPPRSESSATEAAATPRKLSAAPTFNTDPTNGRLATGAGVELDSATLTVVDEAGLPVVHAACAICPSECRSLSVSSTSIVGWTDLDGKLVLRNAWVRGHSSETLSVLHTQYRPATVAAIDLLDGTEAVTLTSGFAFHVRCVDLDGMPVVGALVVASASEFDAANEIESPSPTLPGPNSASRIITARSGEDGIAVISGMDEGRYGVAAFDETRAVVSTEDDETQFDVPLRQETTYVFGSIVALVAQFESDSVATWQGGVGAGYKNDGLAQAPVARWRERLTSRYPDCAVVVAARTKVVARDAWSLVVVFAHHERQTYAVEPIPVTELDGPVSIHPSGAPVAELPTAEVIVLDAGGRPVSIPGFYLQSKEPGQTARYEMEPDKPCQLPAGEYRLKSSNRLVSLSLNSDAVRVPGANTLSLRANFRECNVWFLDASGVRLESVQVQIDAAGVGSTHTYFTPSGAPLHVWLPVGTCVVRIDASDGVPMERSFEVVALASQAPQDVVLR
ncbi:MAG: hypothetical protein IT453_01325 [Planctomycetes bacterium]|nr:hypothetical protein [Planctomycetota bacterium]